MSDEKEQVRGRILSAAAEEFMINGYANATIDSIADRIGATKGLIYYYFRSKFDLFLSIYEISMQLSIDSLTPLAADSGTGRERLEQMCVAHLFRIMVGPQYHSVIHQGVSQYASMPIKPHQMTALIDLNKLRTEYEKIFRTVVEEGVADRSLRPIPAGLATRILLGSMNSIDSWYRHRSDDTDSIRLDLARSVTNLVLDGLSNSNLEAP